MDGLFRERPANDEALDAAEQGHRSAVQYELRTVGARLARLVLRLARGTLSADVWVPSPTGPARQHIFELLTFQRRILVVGGRASGKTALAKLLASQAADRDLGFGSIVPIAIDGEQLDTFVGLVVRKLLRDSQRGVDDEPERGTRAQRSLGAVSTISGSSAPLSGAYGAEAVADRPLQGSPFPSCPRR
jgi:hypothetical protein